MSSTFAWYLDLTPNKMFSDFYAYSLPGKTGLPLCQEHGRQLELKEVVLLDEEATLVSLLISVRVAKIEKPDIFLYFLLG
jgi:hypothetical protein